MKAMLDSDLDLTLLLKHSLNERLALSLSMSVPLDFTLKQTTKVGMQFDLNI